MGQEDKPGTLEGYTGRPRPRDRPKGRRTVSESNMQKMQSASDYIPTTEEVRRAYRNSEYGGPDTEFDRWLAEERNKVRETSRQIYEQRGRTSERESLMNGVIIGAALAGVTLLVIQVLMTGGI